ncbi:hypothetical protein Bresa_02047|uniref:Uncharacterized protein n=1 Tax=Brenneria salicis ATCC 15712 = DSM 30166 TaxID=714314 RepID=A0A366I188_9GAMM|nr:hypothetical protein [Brenneria salicis ATCC 15712 = DSM 30166]RBP59873.1 hypothetical protein DES54_1352 [Brenneria salicis ATCC 15712 = DSM 30166]
MENKDDLITQLNNQLKASILSSQLPPEEILH